MENAWREAEREHHEGQTPSVSTSRSLTAAQLSELHERMQSLLDHVEAELADILGESSAPSAPAERPAAVIASSIASQSSEQLAVASPERLADSGAAGRDATGAADRQATGRQATDVESPMSDFRSRLDALKRQLLEELPASSRSLTDSMPDVTETFNRATAEHSPSDEDGTQCGLPSVPRGASGWLEQSADQHELHEEVEG